MDLSHLLVDWDIEADGRIIASGRGDIPPTAAGESAELVVPYRLPPAPEPGVEHWLNIRFRLAAATAWAEAGHEVAWAQFELPVNGPAASSAPPAPGSRPRTPARKALRVERRGPALEIAGPDFRLDFDIAMGRIAGLEYRGRKILRQGPRLTFWRATTDNDRAGWGPSRDALHWMEKGLHRLQHRVDDVQWEMKENDSARVSVRSRIAPPVLGLGFDAEYQYTIDAGGAIRLEVRGDPSGSFPTTLPRIGLQLHVPVSLDRVEWFGLGPHESYPDSRMSARVV